MKSFRRYFRSLLIVPVIFLSSPVNGQDNNAKESKPFRLPVVSIGVGQVNFSGDVGYNRINLPLTAQSGFQITVRQQTEHRFSYGLFLLSGTTFGDEKTISRALNFKSSLLCEGLQFRYSFTSSKRSDQVLIPYITAGIEYINFHSRTDLKDKDGKTYHYWSDGTIRDIAQDDINADQAVLIHRDYNYETDLQDANLDGTGKYKSSTWGAPVGAGIVFRISERCSLDFSSVCHFTGTDYIDGITADGKGVYQGNSKNDKFIYSSVSFAYAIPSPSKNDDYKNIDFNALVNEDADGDGIPDILDDSSGTPQNNPVDSLGRPIDTDNDGIPDYRDKEPNSASDAVVNEDGVTITEEMIEEKFRKDSLAALPAVIEYLKSYDKLTQRNPDAEKKWIEKNSKKSEESAAKNENPIPKIYRALDLDHNGIITPKEISLAIDDYLAKKSPYTVSQFFDLIDFFFSQK